MSAHGIVVFSVHRGDVKDIIGHTGHPDVDRILSQIPVSLQNSDFDK